MPFLKQSTAYTFRLGPFLDSVDGNTQENALTIAAASVLLSKAGGALAAKTEATALTGTGANAHYTCLLDTTDTNTLGMLRVWAHITGALAVYKDFLVLPALVYDSLVAGSDLLQADMTQILGTAVATPATAGLLDINVKQISTDAVAADNLELMYDGTGYAGGTARLKVDVDTIKTQAITCAAGVTVLASVGTAAASTAQTGDCFPLVSTEVAEIYAAVITNAAGADIAADIIAVKTDTGNLVTRIPAALFANITSLAQWLGLLGGKQVGDATARTELRATGAGAGTFDETTDSQEAIRDTAPLGTAMRGTDSAALASVCTEARLSELDAGTPGKAAAVVDVIAVDVAGLDGAAMRGTDSAALASVCTEGRLAELDAANLPTDVAARATPAQVNAEVLDVLNVDTFAEPGQEAPAATNTLAKKIGYLFKFLRNKVTQDVTTLKIYADDGITVDQKSTVSDDATTYTRGEIGSGP